MIKRRVGDGDFSNSKAHRRDGLGHLIFVGPTYLQFSKKYPTNFVAFVLTMWAYDKIPRGPPSKRAAQTRRPGAAQ